MSEIVIFNTEPLQRRMIGYISNDLSILSKKEKYVFNQNEFEGYLATLYKLCCFMQGNGATAATIDNIRTYFDSETIVNHFTDAHAQLLDACKAEVLDLKEDFDSNYEQFKKVSILRTLSRSGFSINEFITQSELGGYPRLNSISDQISPKEILDKYRDKLNNIEQHNLILSDIQNYSGDFNIDDLLDSINEQEDLGLEIQGSYTNYLLGGARLGTLTVRSAGSGIGKTRIAVGDACYLAYPIRWENGWKFTGYNESVLIVITEQTVQEVQKMMLAYISGVPENRFRYAKDLTEDELNRIKIASEVMKHFKDNMHITRMPEPTVDSIKTQIREQIRLYDCQYVFFDYIQVNPSLYREFAHSNLRTDEALLLMTTALKDIAVEQKVCVFTSTQISANGDNKGDNTIKNESSIAGARAVINKADNGMIMMRPTPTQIETLKGAVEGFWDGAEKINMITDVYKVRNGAYTNVKIWSYVDLSVMRRYDYYVTDMNGNIITDMDNFNKYKTEFLTSEEKQEITSWAKEVGIC